MRFFVASVYTLLLFSRRAFSNLEINTFFNNEMFWNDQESKFLNHWKSLLYLDRLLWLQPLEITSLPWSVVMIQSCYDSKFIIWASHQRKEWVDAAILFGSLTNRMFFSADNGVSFRVIWPQKMSGTNIVGKLLSNSILVLFFSNSTYGTCILFMRLIDSSLLFEYSGLAVIKLIFVLL